MAWIRVNGDLKYTRKLQLLNSIDNPMLLLDGYPSYIEGCSLYIYRAISLIESPDITVVPAKEENKGESLMVKVDERYTLEDIGKIRIQCGDDTTVCFANSNEHWVHAIKPGLSGTTILTFLEEGGEEHD